MSEAEALRASLTADSRDQQVHGPRIKDCADRYLASRTHEITDRTRRQYEVLLSRFRGFCELRGAYFMRELTVDLIETFKVDGLTMLGDTSKATVVAKLRCFLRDAFRRGWLTEDLAGRVTTHRATYEQKEPYTDEEISAILECAASPRDETKGYSGHPGTFRLLLELMLSTGMRVSDAVSFDPSVLNQGERMWVYTYIPHKHKKTGRTRHIEAYLPNQLKSRIDGCQWLSHSLPFSYNREPAYLANRVYRCMQTIGKRCGVEDCRPHRLRDTFAVRMLLNGVPLDDVSRLLGHSSVTTTEMYYAKWVAARKIRLERIVAESFVNA
jgi:site-specific recombinase XerD